MRAVRRRWTVSVVAIVAAVILVTAGIAVAAANQFQGKSRKEYVHSGAAVVVTTTSWTLLSDLTTSGTWGGGDLLIARFTVSSRCQSAVGVFGYCRVRIALDCLDEGGPSAEFLPAGAAMEPFDSAPGSPYDSLDAESLATTRYLPLDSRATAGCVVIAEASVSNDGVIFILGQPVLTIDVVASTVT